ncbi:MAG: 1-deoxy-D-xylulose-5-phosphate reductoisomerase [Spirochaetes bacterium RBG_16_49_21]|nr:MAG: 1-deoxy-D-xylulose-5-phosphate reductoisomerase [Spirochaetes bacterium RBG_16_49_21]
MKSVTVLGSTGSIGLQTLDVIRKNRKDFTVAALSCGSNIDILERQIREFEVKTAAVFDERKAKELRARVPARVLSGLQGIVELAKLDSADLVLNALVGSIGIRPTVAAIEAGKNVALANKETLVSAGVPVMERAKKHGAVLFPVDSEHSAIFQCLNGENKGSVRRLIITCSGGAFRNHAPADLRRVTAADALKHPSWNMGAKITVDSATLMNKGFEVIEAKMLFGIDYDDIEVVIHPQSIIHSLVEFADCSVLAQLSNPDMRLPIQYALTYPARVGSDCRPLDMAAVKTLSFSPPDTGRFPCIRYAIQAGRTGGTMPCVLNAANEVAVRAFLAGKIGFMDIPELVLKKLDGHEPCMNPDIEELLALDERIKRETMHELHMEREPLPAGVI